MKWLKQGLLFAFSVVVLRAEGETSPTTRWTEIEERMGEIQLDGSLNYRRSLGNSEALALLGLHLGMEHVVDVDEAGRGRSGWRFLGLQTSLAPSGRERLRWKALMGPTVDFARAEIGAAFSQAGRSRTGQWLIRTTVEGGHEIHSPEGISWRYEAGRLVEIAHPVLGRLRVSTQGAWVTRIERSEGADGAGFLLEAVYSDEGHLLKLQVGGQAGQEFIWSEGQLLAWRNAAGETLNWRYSDGLLAQISGPGQAAREIRWRENKGFGRGDSRWALPVHLAAVDDVNYSYTLTNRGFVLTRETSAESGVRVVKTRFNPLRYRLEQWANGESLMVRFRKRSPGRGAVERIETASGEVLEEYRYDAEGRLVGVRKLGEPPWDFRYDHLGRLIKVEGEPVR